MNNPDRNALLLLLKGEQLVIINTIDIDQSVIPSQ
jgi:hypothetical protein